MLDLPLSLLTQQLSQPATIQLTVATQAPIAFAQKDQPDDRVPLVLALDPPNTEIPNNSLQKSSPTVLPISRPDAGTPATTPNGTTTLPLTPEATPTFDRERLSPPMEHPVNLSPGERRRLRLNQQLTELVKRDQPEKAARLQENLINSARAYAKQQDYNFARQVANNPALPAALQAQTKEEINQIETNNIKVGLILKLDWSGVGKSFGDMTADQLQAFIGHNTDRAPKSVSSGGYANSLASYPVESTTAASRSYYALSTQLPFRLGNNNASLIFPLPIPAPLTSAFGWRMHPITGDRRFHTGTDLGAPFGTPVVATYSGKVEVADLQGGYGLTVTISHQGGVQQTLYAHLSEVFVKAGDWVEQGTVIGRVGSTGNSTGPHLHFEFWQFTPEGWVVVDPGPQLEYALAQLGSVILSADASVQSPTLLTLMPTPRSI